MMKKKPPAGATLIARLKEQRMARDAEIARRQSGDAPVETEPAVGQGLDPSRAEPVPQESAPDKVESVEVSVVEPISETNDNNHVGDTNQKVAREAKQTETETISPKPKSSQTQSVSAVAETTSPQTQIVLRSNSGDAADLLHRQIEIEDLLPTTDDYFVLTDEIRLAGRFAAVGLIAQGLRLTRLKQQSIYKEHYQTFEDYCRKEHQMSATYAYRLIRMSEMAERMAELGSGALSASSDTMPDPFEVMLSLGHRHLMALLPLEPERAQELIVRGIPVHDANDGSDERVPIGRATEKQIREALKVFNGDQGTTKIVPTKALASEKQLIPALSKLVEMLEDWSLWLGGEAPDELQAARMGRGQLLNRLAKRFRAASGKIADALEGEDEK